MEKTVCQEKHHMWSLKAGFEEKTFQILCFVGPFISPSYANSCCSINHGILLGKQLLSKVVTKSKLNHVMAFFLKYHATTSSKIPCYLFVLKYYGPCPLPRSLFPRHFIHNDGIWYLAGSLHPRYFNRNGGHYPAVNGHTNVHCAHPHADKLFYYSYLRP